MVDLVQFTLDLKIAFNYKLNTMFYRKCQFILTFRISLFFLTGYLLGIENLSIPILPCLYWQI